jgi:Gas vesicle protein
VSPAALPAREIALVDLLDRLLAGGIVLTGDITLAIADIDMVQISLRALITSLSRSARSGAGERDA